MKKIFSFIIFCFYLSSFYSQDKKVFNKIDSLTSAKDVQDFINNEHHKINYYLSIGEKTDYDLYCKVIADSLDLKQNWEKADFDNNGLTDLLVTGNTYKGYQTIYILDKGDHFESKNLSLGELYEKCYFTSIKDNKIKYQSIKILSRLGFLSNLIKENLIYKYGGFIEENTNPKRHNILEIEFENRGSYWNRSILEMKIVSNREVIWTSRNDNFLNSGGYTSKLSQEKFKEIIDLLNYTDFENLADSYEANYSDAAITYLKITYDNLKVKTIRDNGGMGTRGLRRFYDQLIDLQSTEKWIKQN